MSINTIKSTPAKTSAKVDSAVRSSTGEHVLVVYQPQAAHIYYEITAPAAPVKPTVR